MRPAHGAPRWAARTRRDLRTLTPVDPAELLLDPREVASPVLQVVLARAAAGSRPGARDDGHGVCLAVEGGGMRGAVSAGMCVLLEAAGLVGAFDRIYGVSAGALNGSATALGRAALGSTHYQDAAARRVVNPARPLVRRPVVDFDLLFGELLASKPLPFDRRADGPEFRALATSLEDGTLRVLRDFADGDELMAAVRASAALPVLGGSPPLFRGERMVDGGIVEAIPYETALREGATHVLVLRSRPAGFRKPPFHGVAERVTARGEPEVAGLLRGHRDAYNRQATQLQRLGADLGRACVQQVAVPDGLRLIGRLEANPTRVADALRAGAAAMAEAVLREPVELCWQPVAYRTTVAAGSLPA